MRGVRRRANTFVNSLAKLCIKLMGLKSLMEDALGGAALAGQSQDSFAEMGETDPRLKIKGEWVLEISLFLTEQCWGNKDGG